MILGQRQLSLWMIVLFGVAAACLRAEDVTADVTRDTLVYKDGDRVHGTLVSRTADVIVFKSERFGELRVSAADAVVIKAQEPAPAVSKQVVAAGIHPVPTAQERAEREKVSIWDRFSPAVLTAHVREFFGPWTGRLAFSNDIVTDTADRNSLALEGKLSRKFTRDRVDLSARYDSDETNNVHTTDLFRANGMWRHDFTRRRFGQYRPTFEWNRANLRRKTLPDEYMLVQQEIGFGVNVWSTPARQVRLGVSENLFDVWGSGPASGSHTSRAVASLFDEVEVALPWRMSLVQRGVWYPESPAMNAFEDQIELNKKLTETLSLAVRHEIRRNNPDGTLPDYTRLKLLLALDF